jgi:hypothetical protein
VSSWFALYWDEGPTTNANFVVRFWPKAARDLRQTVLVAGSSYFRRTFAAGHMYAWATAGTHLLSYRRRAIARIDMSPTHDPACHQVYLLSLWRETPAAPWRAALRPAGGEERLGFADLESLALFLLRLNDSRESLATETTEDRDIEDNAAKISS